MKPGIDEIVSLGEFQRTYNWEIKVIPIPGVWLKLFGIDCLNYRCTNVTLPTATNQAFDVNIRGAKAKCTGYSTYNGEITLTLLETEDAKVRKLCRAWRNVTYEPITGLSAGKLINSITLQIKQLGLDGRETMTYTAINCRLTKEAPDNLNSRGELQSIKLTVIYDTFTDIL